MVLEIKDAVKLVQNTRALNGFELKLDAGKRVVINGLYAHELIDMLLGEPIDSGQILLEGRPICKSRNLVGILTRDAALPPKLSVCDCVRLCCKDNPLKYLKAAGIEPIKSAHIERLSLIERKLVMLACTSAKKPKLLAASLYGLTAREHKVFWQAADNALDASCAIIAVDALNVRNMKQYYLTEGKLKLRD